MLVQLMKQSLASHFQAAITEIPMVNAQQYLAAANLPWLGKMIGERGVSLHAEPCMPSDVFFRTEMIYITQSPAALAPNVCAQTSLLRLHNIDTECCRCCPTDSRMHEVYLFHCQLRAHRPVGRLRLFWPWRAILHFRSAAPSPTALEASTTAAVSTSTSSLAFAAPAVSSAPASASAASDALVNHLGVANLAVAALRTAGTSLKHVLLTLIANDSDRA